jgi:hypothetical protein
MGQLATKIPGFVTRLSEIRSIQQETPRRYCLTMRAECSVVCGPFLAPPSAYTPHRSPREDPRIDGFRHVLPCVTRDWDSNLSANRACKAGSVNFSGSDLSLNYERVISLSSEAPEPLPAEEAGAVWVTEGETELIAPPVPGEFEPLRVLDPVSLDVGTAAHEVGTVIIDAPAVVRCSRACSGLPVRR